MSADSPQPHYEQPEDNAMPFRARAQRDLGDIMLNGTPDELETLPELTADDFAALEAIANGADIRAEDAGRTHDIEAAHDEAIEEDAERTLALQRQQAQEEQPEEQVVGRAAAAAVRALQAAAAHQSTRQQAQEALRSAGGFGHIPAGATVRKDPFSNTFTVSTGDHVQIIRPRPIGDRYDVTDYRYNEEDHTLRISIRGHSSLMQPSGTFTSVEAADTPEGSVDAQEGEPQPQELGEAINLPAVVARMVGVARVARVPAHS
jgi:biotin carboxyl carrier protein